MIVIDLIEILKLLVFGIDLKKKKKKLKDSMHIDDENNFSRFFFLIKILKLLWYLVSI